MRVESELELAAVACMTLQLALTGPKGIRVTLDTRRKLAFIMHSHISRVMLVSLYTTTSRIYVCILFATIGAVQSNMLQVKHLRLLTYAT